MALFFVVGTVCGCADSDSTAAAPAAVKDEPAEGGDSAGENAADDDQPTAALDQPTERADVEREPECLTAPQAAGDPVSVTNGPYLQWPTLDGITVAFETLEQVPGTVAVWREGEPCLDAIAQSEPAVMDMASDILIRPAPPGFQHAAQITGLQPGTRYNYKVVIGGTVTDASTFRTTPSVSVPSSGVLKIASVLYLLTQFGPD